MFYDIKIDAETADQIVVSALKNYLECLEESLSGNSYIHPDDIEGNKKRIEALKLIISDYTVFP